MPNYIVNINTDENGNHEVHQTSPNACAYLPNKENQKDLGWHSNCHGAVKEAKKFYTSVDGCGHCSDDCHTGK